MNPRLAALVHPGCAAVSAMHDLPAQVQEVLGEGHSYPKSVSEHFYGSGARNELELFEIIYSKYFLEEHLLFFCSAKAQVYTGNSHLQLSSRGVTTE